MLEYSGPNVELNGTSTAGQVLLLGSKDVAVGVLVPFSFEFPKIADNIAYSRLAFSEPNSNSKGRPKLALKRLLVSGYVSSAILLIIIPPMGHCCVPEFNVNGGTAKSCAVSGVCLFDFPGGNDAVIKSQGGSIFAGRASYRAPHRPADILLKY